LLQVAKLVLCVFIKAARHHKPIPGDYAGVPELPTVVEEFVFHSIRTICLPGIAGVTLIKWDKWITVLIIVDLCCFQPDFINADLFSQLINFRYLMLIRADHQKLKDDVGCRRTNIPLCFYDVSGALQHRLQVARFTVIFINFLRSAVHGNNKTVQPGGDRLSCI